MLLILELIAAHLAEAEWTEDWDARKLRIHIEMLSRSMLYMSTDDYRRFEVIVRRYRQHLKQPSKAA